MEITDKTRLRTALRAALRETAALDLYTELSSSPMIYSAQYGLKAMLRQAGLRAAARRGRDSRNNTMQHARALLAGQPPLGDEALDIRRAVDALGLDTDRLDGGFGAFEDAGAYADAVFAASGLRGYLSPLDPKRANAEEKQPEAIPYLDVRSLQEQLARGDLSQLDLTPEDAQVGTLYLKLAAWLFQTAKDEGARMLMASLEDLEDFPRQAFLRHVILPTCEKSGLILMVLLTGPAAREDLDTIRGLLRRSEALRVICVAGDAAAGQCLIEAAYGEGRIFPVLPALGDLIGQGIRRLGAGFGLCGGGVSVLELFIGRWGRVRGALLKELTARYTSLLTSGFVLTDEMVREDVEQLLGGAFEAFLGMESPQER